MRVLYFSRDYTPHDLRFLSALARSEHTVAYLRLEDGGRVLESQPIPPQIASLEWTGGKRPVRAVDGMHLLADLKRVLDAWKPDLVHAGPLQRCAFLTALAGFRPLVSMSWGYDLLFDAKKNFLWSRATRYTLKRSAVFVGDCDAIRREAVGYGMDPARIVTFPWGTDLQHFRPDAGSRRALRAELGWQDAFVLFSGRGFSPIYGTLELARAFTAAAVRIPDLRLLMLGGGPQEAEIRDIFEQGGVMARVHFVGQVGREALPQYYRASDLYLSASHSDGTSISLLEALASGLPALVSDIPGNREWVAPDVQGWLFPVGDAGALEEGICTAYARRGDLGGIAENARRTAEERGDWERNFPRLLDAYRMAV